MMMWSGLLFSQPKEVKPLLDSLANVTDPVKRVDLLNVIAGEASEIDIDFTIKKAEEARELALSQNYIKGVADANKWIGKGNALKGKTAESLHNFMDALQVYNDLSDSLEIANIYKYLANAYSNNDNDREAMRYYKEAKEIYDRIHNTKGISAILNNIGTIYLSRDNPDSALYYLNQSRLSYQEIKDESGLATNYTNMGYAYSLKKEYSKAINYYKKCYDLSKKLGIKESMSTSLLNIGDANMYLENYTQAELYVMQGLKIAKEEGFKYNEYIGSYTLGEINERKGDYKKSLEWYHKAENIYAELRNTNTTNALMEVQTMQLAEAQNREIERINAINAERIKTEKFKNLLFLSVAGFSLLMLLGLTYYYMKRHKATLKIALQHKEIASQKEQIEKQSKKIEQVNATLKERNKKLRAANEEKNYMMSVVAHDLKSPLNQINGLANVIKLDAGNLNDTQQECLDNISLASARLSEMVNKILDSRNFDTKHQNLQIEALDIEKVASEVLNDFSTTATKKSIDLHKNTINNGAIVKADRHYLRQVLDNLVSNAIKFSPEGKSVSLNIIEEGEKVRTEVVDEGPGLTAEDKKLLFTEYATLSAKPTGGEKSTGLGLAIVKNYVEKMGGKIWCESEYGHGATFKLELERAS